MLRFHRSLALGGLLVATAALSGCAAAVPSSPPAFDDAKSVALDIRAEVEATLPAGVAGSTTDVDNKIGCDADTAQYDGTRKIEVASDFDSAQWLDSVADEYGDQSRWKSEKNVAADGSSDTTLGLSLSSTDGFYVRIDAIAGSDGSPVVILSASSPCASL